MIMCPGYRAQAAPDHPLRRHDFGMDDGDRRGERALRVDPARRHRARYPSMSLRIGWPSRLRNLPAKAPR